MLIIHGTIVGVVDKNTHTDKPWAIVGIEAQSVNRNGLIETKLYELTVFGDAVKQGLHNVYRGQKGVEVYAPISVSLNERYKEINYQLAGIPLRIQGERAPAASPSKPAATQ